MVAKSHPATRPATHPLPPAPSNLTLKISHEDIQGGTPADATSSPMARAALRWFRQGPVQVLASGLYVAASVGWWRYTPTQEDWGPFLDLLRFDFRTHPQRGPHRVRFQLTGLTDRPLGAGR